MSGQDAAEALLAVACVGSGLIAGIFFAFSSFIMKAFDRLPARLAISAMQQINSSVLNATFLSTFFGMALVCAALAIWSSFEPAGWRPWFALAGACCYLMGTFGVTSRKTCR